MTAAAQVFDLDERFCVRLMEESDLDEVLAIENDSFPTPWGREAFWGEIKAEVARAYVVSDRQTERRNVVGYACFWEVDQDFHLLNLCVAAPHRGQGLGRRLLSFILSLAQLKKKRRVFLEARSGNRAALNLYRAAGFRQVGLRPGYYSDSGEDAILMDWPAG